MTIQLLDGSILLDSGSVANHEDCCCVGTDCFICSFSGGRPGTWRVDLLGGGWIDEDCDYCDQVMGTFDVADFQVGNLPNCLWLYTDEEVCTFGPPNFNPITFRIIVFEFNLGGGVWRWDVDVLFLEGGLAQRAIYRSATSSTTDCFDLGGEDSTNKITLNKFSDVSSNAFNICDIAGALPDPIFMWVP